MRVWKREEGRPYEKRACDTIVAGDRRVCKSFLNIPKGDILTPL